MNREVSVTSLGTVVASAAAGQTAIAAPPAGEAASPVEAPRIPQHPCDTRLCVKPVMANVIHTHPWQGPCRWTSASAEVEKANAEQSFARWSKQLKTAAWGDRRTRLLEPVHVTFSEDWC